MMKKICRQCGGALTEGARFCTSCGAITGRAETASVFAPETRPLPREQTDQVVPGNAGVTEELSPTQTAPRKGPSDYDTEELPQTRITAQADERSTTVAADAPVTQPQIQRAESAPANRAPANQASSGRKGLLVAAALGAAALAAGSFFFINSRRPSEPQAANQPDDKAKPAASAQRSSQPTGQPAGRTAAANDQGQPQPAPTADEVKSPKAPNADAGSKAPQTREPASVASQEKKDADGTGAATHNLSQGTAYMNAGRYQEALREFEYVKKLDPGNKSVYYLIGQTYHKMSQLERALEAYRQCTSGVYASVSQTHVKTLEKKLGKTY